MSHLARLAAPALALWLAASGAMAGDENGTVGYWRDQLRAEDPVARVAAARGLALSGSDAEVAVPDLAEALTDPDAGVRRAAADALRAMGTAAGPAARALARALANDADKDVRQAAARALTRVGAAAQGAVPEVIEGLGAADPTARRLACGVLGDLGLAGESVRAALVQVMVRDDDSRVRQAARTALKQLGVELGGHVSDLLGALQDPSPEVRENAAEWLAEVKPRPLEAVDPLLDVVMYDAVPRVRAEAARTVRDMGTDASAAVPRLLDTLRDGDRDQRASSAEVLGSVSLGAARDVDALLATSARDPELSVRLSARGSLVRLIRTNRAVFDRFIAAVAEPGPAEARVGMIDALGRLAEEAAPALPNLLIALREGPEDVRVEAARALGRIGAPAFDAVLPLRRAAAWDRSAHVRDAAEKAVKHIRTAAGRREPERVPDMPAAGKPAAPPPASPGDGAEGGR